MADSLIDSIAPGLSDRIARIAADQRVPGVAVGIVRGQQLAWHAGFGFADLATGRAVDQHTLFRIASITKTFTAAAIMQLQERKRLGLDEALGRYLPEFRAVRNRFGPIDQVTIRRLLTHRSGLVGEPPTGHWSTGKSDTTAEILATLPRIQIAIEPDSAFKYSNLAFALLGEVVARVSERPYPDYVRDELLRPLEMDGSGFDLDADRRARMATGYRPHPHEDLPGDAVPLESGALATDGGLSAGGLRSSVADLAKWIALQFRTRDPAAERDSAADSKIVLSARSLREMHRVSFVEADWKSGYCLPWWATRVGDNIYLHHGGAVEGFLSFVAFNKLYRVGVIVLTNATDHFAHEAIAFETLETLMAREKEVRAAVVSPPSIATPPELRPLLGRYRWQFGDLLIEFRNGRLVLAVPPGLSFRPSPPPSPLIATDQPNVFIASAGRPAGEPITFEIGADGQATGFMMGEKGFPYRKVL
jgi:CubicO group peptidase (beta-lactamase class C family)